jgi:uncharacterized protein DUF1569
MATASPAQTNAAAHAHIDTAKVTGRRTVCYNSYDELLADAERLATIENRTLGNWSLGQIYKHLAKAIHMTIDGPPFLLPWPMRIAFTLFMKKRMLQKSLPPGFKLPKKAEHMLPEPTTTADGLELLRAAVQRVKSTPQRGLHPAFGKMGPGEWDQFQLRHCEMHMSFVVPTDPSR